MRQSVVMTRPVEQVAEYRCPGESYPIDRAMHLARMATFYPMCRECPHRDDTGTHSARLTRRLVETRFRADHAPLFHDGGISGVYLNDIGPSAVRRLAAAMGLLLRRQVEDDAPVVLVAGDGRPMMAELVAAATEGLRWTGCNVVDLGRASAGCMAFAVRRFEADGGVLLGNPGRRPQDVGLKFWQRGGAPLSSGGPLETLQEIFERPMDRPTRKFGSLRRLAAAEAYRATLAEHYHALRPLRLVLDSACGPLADDLVTLTEPFDFHVMRYEGSRDGLAGMVRTESAHFGARIDGNGETCEIWDERGRSVAWDCLRPLLESVLPGDGLKQATPDALVVLTGLLVVLSQSDRPLGRVLDAAAGAS
jgi:hypothetical protein